MMAGTFKSVQFVTHNPLPKYSTSYDLRNQKAIEKQLSVVHVKRSD